MVIDGCVVDDVKCDVGQCLDVVCEGVVLVGCFVDWLVSDWSVYSMMCGVVVICICGVMC